MTVTVAREKLTEDILDYILGREARNQSLAGKKILLTGSSSQIGLNVIGKALARGADVIALYNKTRVAFAHPNLHWEKGDLSAPGGIYVPEADTLIHTAAIWLLPDALPKLTQSAKRAVVFGSTSVFGKRDSKNSGEQETVGKLRAAEDAVARYAAANKLAVTLFRPTMIYGMGMDGNITRLARAIKKFGVVPIAKPANGLRNPVHAADLAEAALAVIGNAKTFGKAYNLGGAKPLPYRAMVEAIFSHLHKKPRMFSVPLLAPALDMIGKCAPFLHMNGEMVQRMNADLIFDQAPAVTDFGYHPRGFLEGDIFL